MRDRTSHFACPVTSSRPVGFDVAFGKTSASSVESSNAQAPCGALVEPQPNGRGGGRDQKIKGVGKLPHLLLPTFMVTNVYGYQRLAAVVSEGSPKRKVTDNCLPLTAYE